MADEQNFPTAIVPTRPGTAIERYDRLAEQFGDPMMTLFVMQSPQLGSENEEVRLRAASELLPYRYPKLRSSEMNVNAQGAGQVNIQINIGGPPPPRTLAAPAAPSAVEVDPLS
jgi:hypothetical protein